jgi:hypothetical protein
MGLKVANMTHGARAKASGVENPMIIRGPNLGSCDMPRAQTQVLLRLTQVLLGSDQACMGHG